MRLRLGLLNKYLAERFRVSLTLCSYIFTRRNKLLSKVLVKLRKALVVLPPKESKTKHLPEIFFKPGYGKCWVIIDCAEVLIERLRWLSVKAATWSGYKHLNTSKLLVGITPTGFILFPSSCYGGQASDKFITRDS